ncbi:TetR/AcrR family transcriptional regulator [Enteractinococcus helveticum]|nr:TetR family transcriptional regulator [Enteractinococcus helveticum]
MSMITRDELSRVGLRLLADHGLADVSMRRVAKEFDVAVSALYWHVKDKQSLLGAMVDQLLTDLNVAPPTDNWRADLIGRAELLYAKLLDTRDAAELTASVLALGTGGTRMREVIDEVSPNTVTTDAIMSLLIGHATLNQQRMQAQALGIDVAPTTTTTFRQALDLLIGD